MFGHSNEHEVQLWIMKILLRGGKWLEKCFLLAEEPYDKPVKNSKSGKCGIDENFMARCIMVYIEWKWTISANKIHA